MPRPHVIKEETRIYSLLLAERMFSELHQRAFDESKRQGRMVSVAHLIRKSIERYLDNEINDRR